MNVHNMKSEKTKVKKNMQVPLHEVLTRTEWILASTGDAGPTFFSEFLDFQKYFLSTYL